MADPKKPAPDPKTDEPIPPEQMTYPTPELDPATGAPLDTRFQSDVSQEVVAQQPPKSETAPAPQDENDEEEDEDEDDDKASKGKEKSKRRR